MALKNVLFTENGGGQNADEVRLLIAGLLGGEAGHLSGIVRAEDFAPTEKAGTPDMSVSIAAGHLFIEGSRSAAQGVYHVYNDATASVAIPAAHPTLPRIDVVYVRVRDSAYDAAFTGQDDAVLLVAQGTPHASPTVPTVSGDDVYPICQVAVAALETAIEDVHITDLRGRLRPWHTPWGRIGSAQITAAAGGAGTTAVDVPGLAVSFTAVAGRRYRIGLSGYTQMAAGAASHNTQSFYIADAAGNPLAVSSEILPSGESRLFHNRGFDTTLTAGAATIKLQVVRSGGSGNVEAVGYATSPTQLWVDDVGPA